MAGISPYITFQGNCEEAFGFYKSVFGGEFPYVGRFSEMPKEYNISEEDANLIMHISLPIGKGSVLMGSDTVEGFGPPFNAGNNFSISADADSKAHADELFTKLSQGGQVTMPMADTFWGSYFGMLVDQFGIQWMVGYDSPEEQS